MQVAGRLRVVALVSLALFPTAKAQALDGVVIVTMAGEAHRGSPKFRFSADDRVLGNGNVTRALRTEKGRRLDLKNSDKPLPTQRFVFRVPNIEAVSRFGIEFTNDAAGGKGEDRNLFLTSLSVSIAKQTETGSLVTIREFLPKAFQSAAQKAEISSRYAALYSNGSLILRQPSGGWQSLSDPPAAPATEQEASAPPVQPEQPEAAQAPQPAKARCEIPALELRNFGKNSAGLSKSMRDRLAGLGKPLRGKSCSARVTAFTGGGSKGFRSSLSRARAQAVATELVRLGIPRGRIQTKSASGGGRRVVITFH